MLKRKRKQNYFSSLNKKVCVFAHPCVVINVIENKNEQCTVWDRVVMLIMTQKTGADFYIISYNFVIVVSVK